MKINELVEESHKLAVEKGWYETKRGIPESLCLIHSEISEALEAYRDGSVNFYILNGKPEGFGVELADAVIRIADLAGSMGLDLEEIIRTKHEYNKTRPHRHGGKKA